MSHSMLLEAFETAFREAGWELTPGQLDLAVRHGRLLQEWNAATNLTRITEPTAMARRHFLESFEAGRLVPPGPATLLDVGAGAGFPGLALRIVRPDVHVTSLEPRDRKAAFLAAVSRFHASPRPEVTQVRLQDFAPRSVFDVVAFRGVHLDIADVLRVLAADGLVISYPSEKDASELRKAGLVEAGRVHFGWGASVASWSRS